MFDNKTEDSSVMPPWLVRHAARYAQRPHFSKPLQQPEQSRFSRSPLFGFQRQRGGVSALTNTSPPAILIPTHHPSATSFHQWVKPRRGGRVTPPPWTHFHVQALIPHGTVGIKFGIKYNLEHTSPLLTRVCVSVCACYGTFSCGGWIPSWFACLTCPIRRSSVRCVQPAASPGEWAGWRGRGTAEGGTTGWCLPGSILAGW